LLGVAIYLLGFALFSGSAAPAILAVLVVVIFLGLALLWLWRDAIVEIEQGTTGVRSRYGKIEGTPRHYLWRPWDRVEFVVDTATEIPYLAPVADCPTRENVPLKAIVFFLKFRIVDPLAYVRIIGASNFDLVLSSAVQDAIRQRSRQVSTEKAYDLRDDGSRSGRVLDYPPGWVREVAWDRCRITLYSSRSRRTRDRLPKPATRPR
jgi:regulator of protease activity HflC (stomatin/prohibitin superfamily)